MTRRRKSKPQNWGAISLAFTEGDAFRKAREQRGLTQPKLAQLANLDVGVIVRLEADQSVEDSSRAAVLKSLRLTHKDITDAVLRPPTTETPDWLLDAKRAAMDFAKAIDRASPRVDPPETNPAEPPPVKRKSAG